MMPFKPRHHSRRLAHACFLAALVAPVMSACATAEPPPSGRIVTSAWARPADSGATGGAYLTILNADSVAVELVSASSPVAVATEVHETMEHDGMSHMMPRTTVPIAPRDSMVMKPGGLHLMLMQLTRALVVNDTIPMTLRFSRGDSVMVRIPVVSP
ncbi:copper chaperone PCu(A)C [Gemmatimonas phototrophica]|nr:copper chaperone PCu(A)C [Gemmatimonas phototrophica]